MISRSLWAGFSSAAIAALALGQVWSGPARGEDAPAQPAAPAVVAPAAPAQAKPAEVKPAEAKPAAPVAAGEPIPVEDKPAAPPKPKKRIPPPPPLETAISSDPQPTLVPDTAFLTAKASERYGAIVDAGGWPTNLVALRPLSKGPEVLKLRKRLSIEADLPAGSADKSGWDDELTQAVKHFQARMGLRATGIVAGATLKAINVPAKTRFTELASSAQRLAGINFPFGDRYVVVNLPSTVVEAVEGGRVAHRYIAIVGDVDHPSPEIAASISVINLNPTWTVPTSIIKKEIIPKMQRDPGWLSRARIRILDGSGAEVNASSIDWRSERAVNYTLRQDSGTGNSLGSIRIGMPNKLAVYMHDTPSKRLFGADYRFLSHGCVRVQGVYDYAEWLLHGTGGGWDKAALLAKTDTHERTDIRLSHPVPVIWVYLTGWAEPDGAVNFRNDVYGLDSLGDVAEKSASPKL